MPIFWTRRTDSDLYRVQWPTRNPRPRIYEERGKSVATLLRELRRAQ